MISTFIVPTDGTPKATVMNGQIAERSPKLKGIAPNNPMIDIK